MLSLANGPLVRRLERIEAVDCKRLSFRHRAVVGAVASEALRRARRACRLRHCTIVHNGHGELVHFDDHLTLGAIACALSHRRALKKLAAHPTAEWGLILEDDVSTVVPRVDLAIGRMLPKLPAEWDAVCLGYHHPIGKPHASAHAPQGNMGMVLSGVDVPVLAARQPIYGLGAWMLRKRAARLLVDSAFPISRQVDYTLTRCLQARGGLFVVNEENMLFYAPSSEEGMDSDVQTMSTLTRVLKKHQSLEDYKMKLAGISNDALLDELLYDYEYGYGEGEEASEAVRRAREAREWQIWGQEEEMWAAFDRERGWR